MPATRAAQNLEDIAEAFFVALVETKLREAEKKFLALGAVMIAATAYLTASWLRLRAQRRGSSPPSSPCSRAGTPGAKGLSKEAASPAAVDIAAYAVAAQPLAPSPPAAAPLGLAAVPGGAAGAVIRTVSSLDLTPELVARLESELVASRNRFVCMQLATMAREQLGAVAVARAAAAAGSADARRALNGLAAMHFAVLEVGGAIVAAAFFYPRRSSSNKAAGSEDAAAGIPGDAGDAGSPRCVVAAAAAAGGAASGPTGASDAGSLGPGLAGLDPHLYVELMCTCRPGAGHGSNLLAGIERHAAAHAAGSLAVDGRRLRAVKLLSVSSAEAFYRRNGYSEPDQHREMAKLLAAA